MRTLAYRGPYSTAPLQQKPIKRIGSFTSSQSYGGTGVPVTMNEDTVASGGKVFDVHSNNLSFPTTGSLLSKPTDFIILNGQGLPPNFNLNGTNSTIGSSGSSVTNPNATCTAFAVAVCPTFPTYVYGGAGNPF